MKILKTLALGAALAASAAFSHAMAAETVRFWYHFDNPANPMSDLVKKFETANPDIKIEAENVPWNSYYDNLYTSIVGGNAPDAAMVKLFAQPRLVEMGALLRDPARPDVVDQDSVAVARLHLVVGPLGANVHRHRYSPG